MRRQHVLLRRQRLSEWRMAWTSGWKRARGNSRLRTESAERPQCSRFNERLQFTRGTQRPVRNVVRTQLLSEPCASPTEVVFPSWPIVNFGEHPTPFVVNNKPNCSARSRDTRKFLAFGDCLAALGGDSPVGTFYGVRDVCRLPCARHPPKRITGFWARQIGPPHHGWNGCEMAVRTVGVCAAEGILRLLV